MRRIQIPRQISVGRVPFLQGLTLRQLAYLVGGGTAASVIAASEADLLVKIPVAALLVGVALALAYLRPENDPLEVWLIRQIAFRLREKGYVFKGHIARPRILDEHRDPVTPGTASAADPWTPARRSSETGAMSLVPRPSPLVGVVIGFWVVAVLSMLFLHWVQSARML